MGTARSLTGRTALVTGAGSGIGAAIADELGREGAYVLVQDVRQEAAAAVAEQIRARGGGAGSIGGDVSNPDDVTEIVATLLDAHDRVDILVNNAGFQYIAPIERFPLEQWNRLLGVLLTGPFLFIQAVLPIMRRHGWGRIINIASVNGKKGDPGKAAYCSAKHGVIGLTRTAALETAIDGITVNAICPGAVDTPLLRNQLGDVAAIRGLSKEDALEKVFLAAIPQKELIDPSEIASMVGYLASDEARSITGQAINVSGGWVMH
ncbi:MAG TPA: 3-hydroxybutyrate dehydrogenase [Thermomicrobiales bacterium]|nr:3-hydroxybutyrate dehydrogenase [Thermomicrobiales bacterium]